MKRAYQIIFGLLLCWPLITSAYTKPGPAQGFVSDFAQILDSSGRQQLESKLSQYAKTSGHEVAIVIIPSLAGDTIENFAVELFKDYGLGKKGQDNGVLLLVALADRQMRIEVGYGLEALLTDAQSSWIINNELVPAFRQNNYAGGLNSAVDKIIAGLGGEQLPGAETSKETRSSWLNANTLYFLFFLLVVLKNILAKSKSWWAGGLIGLIIGVVIGFLKGWLWFGLVSIAILIPAGLALDYWASKSYQKNPNQKSRWPFIWFGGGGFGGSGGFGGGFGGFGGGSSGGGGASGRW